MSTESKPPKDMQIAITVNGEKRVVTAGQTITGLLAELNLAAAPVAVELNRKIIRQPAWSATVCEDAAEVEIVHFVGGG